MDVNESNDELVGNEAMQDFLDKLSTTNVSKWIELPMIAVFGDTSSGKSSLLSNLTMIELPSNHSLTTRCPILLQIRRANVREARIAVQWRENNTSRSSGCCSQEEEEEEEVDDDVVVVSPPPAFEERIATQDNWQSIPRYIQEAQAHILEHTKKDVASDIVSIRISGPQGFSPEQPLTLIDLPGWVQSRGHEDAVDLVSDIQQLLEDYMKNPRCVILAVLPANVDYHNSPIISLAQEVDPHALRTIPVITKPDLIDKGAEHDVLDLLLGNQIRLANNDFHLIKGRGQAALDRKETIQQGLEDEANFFVTKEPWKSVEDRNLFGTEMLRRKLGAIMMHQIKETLPKVIQEIRAKQLEAESQLATMGSPALLTAVDRRRYYQDVCSSFIDQLKASLSGKGGQPTTRHSRKAKSDNNNHNLLPKKKKKQLSAAAQLHESCTEFMDKIRSGSLNTIQDIVEGAHVLVTSPKGDVRGEVVHLDKEFACVDYTDEEDQNIDFLFECRAYKAQQHLEVDDVWSDGNHIYIARKNSVFDSLKRIPLKLIRTDPSWLMDKIKENRTDDLACFLNANIFQNLVEGFVVDDWEPHCQKLLHQTRDILLATINESMEVSMMPANISRYPLLRRFLEKQCRTVAEGLCREANKQVQTHLTVEKHPYTQDQILFDNIAAARYRGLKRELETALKLDQPKQAVYDTEAIREIMDNVFERHQQKQVEEHMAEEMEIVIGAYGKCATKRVIDRTPMICWELFRTLPAAMQEKLWSITDDTLEVCMEESSDFLEAHKRSSEELQEMNKALQLLESVL